MAKYLAHSGVASRRHAESDYIAAGRVRLDGRVVTDPATEVLPGATVRVDGRPVRPEARVTIAMHKPRDVVCTVRDPRGRLTVLDLVPDPPGRLYPVGRLDTDSEGLLLLTNDGGLAARLLHPRFGVPKSYAVLVTPVPAEEQLARLRAGVRLSDGPARPIHVARLQGPPRGAVPGAGGEGAAGGAAWLEMVLAEGRNREARRMCAALGLDVLRLVRVAFAGIRLDGLTPGASRPLSEREVRGLRVAGGGGGFQTGRGRKPEK